MCTARQEFSTLSLKTTKEVVRTELEYVVRLLFREFARQGTDFIVEVRK